MSNNKIYDNLTGRWEEESSYRPEVSLKELRKNFKKSLPLTQEEQLKEGLQQIDKTAAETNIWQTMVKTHQILSSRLSHLYTISFPEEYKGLEYPITNDSHFIIKVIFTSYSIRSTQSIQYYLIDAYKYKTDSWDTYLNVLIKMIRANKNNRETRLTVIVGNTKDKEERNN